MSRSSRRRRRPSHPSAGRAPQRPQPVPSPVAVHADADEQATPVDDGRAALGPLFPGEALPPLAELPAPWRRLLTYVAAQTRGETPPPFVPAGRLEFDNLSPGWRALIERNLQQIPLPATVAQADPLPAERQPPAGDANVAAAANACGHVPDYDDEEAAAAAVAALDAGAARCAAQAAAADPFDSDRDDGADPSDALHDGPFWMPPGADSADLPRELQIALKTVIDPTYRELVCQAEHPLARSTGVTILNLLWLEMVDQLQLARLAPDEGLLKPEMLLAEPRYRQIERHLSTVNAKLKASELYMRIEGATRKWQQQQLDAVARRDRDRVRAADDLSRRARRYHGM